MWLSLTLRERSLLGGPLQVGGQWGERRQRDSSPFYSSSGNQPLAFCPTPGQKVYPHAGLHSYTPHSALIAFSTGGLPCGLKLLEVMPPAVGSAFHSQNRKPSNQGCA